MAERNDDLAYQVLDYIREHPKEWNQRAYFCGTTACFAGWALTIDAWNSDEKLLDLFLYPNLGVTAAKVLGWTWYEAAHVFGNMTEDFDYLEQLVKSVVNGEVEDPGSEFVLPF